MLHLNRESMQLTFPTAFERLRSLFYRSKITSWMVRWRWRRAGILLPGISGAAVNDPLDSVWMGGEGRGRLMPERWHVPPRPQAQQEEDYRFILLETDMEPSAWGELCVSQADCVLLVAAPDSNPEVGELEREVVWQAAGKVADTTTAMPLHPLKLCTSLSSTPPLPQPPPPHSACIEQPHLPTTPNTADPHSTASLSPPQAFCTRPLPSKPQIRCKAQPSPPTHMFGTALQPPCRLSPPLPPPPSLSASCSPRRRLDLPSPACRSSSQCSPDSPSLLADNPQVVRQLRIELVLSHTSDSPPCGTAKWLDCRPHLRRHHHVRSSRSSIPFSAASLPRLLPFPPYTAAFLPFPLSLQSPPFPSPFCASQVAQSISCFSSGHRCSGSTTPRTWQGLRGGWQGGPSASSSPEAAAVASHTLVSSGPWTMRAWKWTWSGAQARVPSWPPSMPRA